MRVKKKGFLVFTDPGGGGEGRLSAKMVRGYPPPPLFDHPPGVPGPQKGQLGGGGN